MLSNKKRNVEEKKWKNFVLLPLANTDHKSSCNRCFNKMHYLNYWSYHKLLPWSHFGPYMSWKKSGSEASQTFIPNLSSLFSIYLVNVLRWKQLFIWCDKFSSFERVLTIIVISNSKAFASVDFSQFFYRSE